MTTTRPTLPSSVSRPRFDHDGFVCPVAVLTEDETRRYHGLYMAFHDQHKTRLDAMKASARWQINADTHFAFSGSMS